MEVFAATTRTPSSNYPERIPRKVHLPTLGVEHLTSVVGHGLTEIEAVASTTSTPDSNCPLQLLVWEPLVSNVSEDLVALECAGWRPLRLRRSTRSLTTQ